MLELTKVRKNFGGLVAVKDVDLSVGTGEIVGLIGPNGAGKTTLFNVVAGVYRPDGGTVVFEGASIAGMKPYDVCVRGIARTFQVVQPFGVLSVEDNVMVGALCHTADVSEAKRITAETLSLLDFAHRSQVPAWDLTIAELKRLELARALATKPRLLLLDEVVAGSNPAEAEDLVAALRRIRDRGVTMLMVEHVMRAVMSISDRVVVLNYGEKIAEGTPRQVARDETVIQAYLGAKYGAARA
jgi:branched-chain amino acid transport system ATP-binding protein